MALGEVMRFLLLVAAAMSPALCTSAIAQTEKVIWNFASGSIPYGDVVRDPNTGVLYGTTYGGGNGYGTVFSLTEKKGKWKYSQLYAFAGGTDGANPYAGVTEDSSGALYGTTINGTVFKLAFNGASWVHTVLYNFTNSDQGSEPEADLTIDRKTGAIYGTTWSGGNGCGVVFELPPSGGETSLHVFAGNQTGDGCYPSRVRMDTNGNLYGVTFNGGQYDCGEAACGTAYTLASGNWNETILYNLEGDTSFYRDGEFPTDVDFDPATGVLYGVTELGGNRDKGTVFEVTNTGGGWQETKLYSFQVHNLKTDGDRPMGLHLDEKTGTLYGTTQSGGSLGFGTVFQLADNGGSWVETVLHSFGNHGDGAYPYARPAEDPNTGYLYGTTAYGGAYDGGTVYQIAP